MLLFQYKKQEDENPEYLQYKDFSLRKRAFTLAKPKTIAPAIKKKMMEADLEFTKLQSLEIDIESPLSSLDWQNVSYVITKVKALVWA